MSKYQPSWTILVGKLSLLVWLLNHVGISSVQAQLQPLQEWDKRFGGSGNEQLTDAVRTADGGYLLAGSSSSGISGNKTQSGRGNNDYWVVKISSLGSKQWDRRFGGNSDDILTDVTRTSDGGYLLGGFSSSGINGDKTQDNRGSTDYWVVKISSTGSKQWDRRFGGADTELLRSVIETSDGGYLLSGYSYSVLTSDPVDPVLGESNFWVVKISSTGIRQWDKKYGGNSDEVLSDVVKTSDGGYLLAGSSWSGISGNKTQTSRGLYDYWVVKISSTGSKQWDKRFGGSSADQLTSVIGTSDGGYLLGGWSFSGINGDKTNASRGGNDFWVVKISSTGTQQWDQTTGGSNIDELQEVMQTSDGGYLLAGYSFSGMSGNKTQVSLGSSDYWIVKISSAGTQLWDQRYGGSGSDYVRDVLETADGGYLLSGYSRSGISGNKTQPSWGGEDYWVVKIGSEKDRSVALVTDPIVSAANTAGAATVLVIDSTVANTAVQTTPPTARIGKSEATNDMAAVTLSAWPNPFTDKVTLSLKLEKSEFVSLQVLDTKGCLVATLYQAVAESNQEYQFALRAGTLPAGTYLVQFRGQDGVRQLKLILVR